MTRRDTESDKSVRRTIHVGLSFLSPKKVLAIQMDKKRQSCEKEKEGSS